MTAYDASNPHQFDAYWRNSETGEMEGVTHEVYAQKRSAAKLSEQKGAEENARLSNHLFDPSARSTYW